MNERKAKFTARIWQLNKMRKEADEIAKEMGFTKTSDIDSFRHAYVAVKIYQASNLPMLRTGEITSRVLGIGNEVSKAI